jgi:hypothetical protein
MINSEQDMQYYVRIRIDFAAWLITLKNVLFALQFSGNKHKIWDMKLWVLTTNFQVINGEQVKNIWIVFITCKQQGLIHSIVGLFKKCPLWHLAKNTEMIKHGLVYKFIA